MGEASFETADKIYTGYGESPSQGTLNFRSFLITYKFIVVVVVYSTMHMLTTRNHIMYETFR